MLDAEHPWPGLRPFAEADSAFFHGRRAESDAVRELIERHPVVVLYGQSGLGKTSLLRAGVFPELKTRGLLPVWVRMDWSAESPSLSRQVLQALGEAFSQTGVEAPAPRPEEGLWTYFHRADADFWGAQNRLVTPVIVLDQFEEIFTLGRRDEAAAGRAEAFLADLEAQLEQRPPASVRERLERHPEEAALYDLNRSQVRFIVSLREDHLPNLDVLRDRLPSLLARRHRLEPMTVAQALEVVKGAGGHLVSDAVADDIVRFVSAGGSDPRVEPAILSVVCNELNLRRVQAGLPQITRELLSGERGRIIADFYERSFESITDATRDWVEDELLTASGHRDRAALEDARRAGVDVQELTRLVERRLLHSDERNHVVWVEFTHDLLTEPALSSRNTRQARQAELAAQRREDEVRRKLRRSRALSVVFGLMAVAMAAGAWRLSEALSEAKAQTKLAQQERQRADQAAASERMAAREAELALARAQQAEKEARESLSLAQQTALSNAEDAVGRLTEQWVAPSYQGDGVVRSNVEGVEPLVKDFGDVDLMRTAYRQLLALAALIQFDRGEERACTALAERSLRVEVPGAPMGPAALESVALSQLAQGSCLQLRGQFEESCQALSAAALSAQALPPGPTRSRIRVAAAINQGVTARWRFRFDDARLALKEAEQALPHAPAEGLLPGEAELMRLAVLELRARLTDSAKGVAAVAREGVQRADRLATGMQHTLRWRAQMLALQLEHARSLKEAGDLARSDVLLRDVISVSESILNVDPGNVAVKIKRLNALRFLAEIQSTWKRAAAATELVDRLDQGVGQILAVEPRQSSARYQQAVATWLRATRTPQPSQTIEQKQASLRQAEDVLTALLRDSPAHGEVRRSLAIVRRDLGVIDAQQSTHGKSPVERRAAMASAQAHFMAALDWLKDLPQAQRHPQVTAVASDIELQAGDVLLSHQDPAGALAAFERGLAWHRRAPTATDSEVSTLSSLSSLELRRNRALRQLGRWREADEQDRQLIARLVSARSRHPGDNELVVQEAWVHRMAASDQLEGKRLNEAVGSQLAAARLLHQALKTDRLSKSLEQELVQTLSYAKAQITPLLEEGQDPVLAEQWAALEGLTPEAAQEPSRNLRAGFPWMPGTWEHLDARSDTLKLLGVVEQADRLRAAGWSLVGARRMTLSFYQNAALVELDLVRNGDRSGVASFVVSSELPSVQLNGLSATVHEMNSRSKLVLSERAQAIGYLRFFLHALQGDESGRFRLVEQPADVIWRPDAEPSERVRLHAWLDGLQTQADPDGDWLFQGMVLYGRDLYRAKFAVSRDGSVQMMNDDPLIKDLPVHSEVYADGVRVLLDLNTTVPVLREALKAEKARSDWPAAARTQQALIDALGKTAPGQQKGRDLADELGSLAWYQLLSRRPAEALKSSEASLQLEPGSLWVETNRAHALLLMDRADEAMALYRKHIGKPIRPDSKKQWVDVILNDLDEFDRLGWKDSRLRDVRKVMEAARP
jgi:tetratricopeptide (TPR) repeat protein